jgi:hypothetical protein
VRSSELWTRLNFHENIASIVEIDQREIVYSPIELNLLSATTENDTVFSPYHVSHIRIFRRSPLTRCPQRGSFIPQIAGIVGKNLFHKLKFPVIPYITWVTLHVFGLLHKISTYLSILVWVLYMYHLNFIVNLTDKYIYIYTDRYLYGCNYDV